MLDLGLHRLRGFDDRERLFQLQAPGLDGLFPRPRTADATAHNLPNQVTSFVGREVERSELMTLVADNRIVTVGGAAGAGKTRLAVEAARDLVDRHPDGVWFVAFARATGPNPVASAVASVLGLYAQHGQSLADTVVDYASSRHMLLVLDACDVQLSAAAELVDRLLAAGDHVRVLATSRKPFGMPGEVVWRIPPLSSEASSGDAHSSAVEMLLDRIESARGGRRPGPEELADLHLIASHLAGSPRAIVLTALSLGEMSAAQIAGQLSDEGPGGAPGAEPTDRGSDSSDFFLFLGASDTEIALGKLRAAGLPHRKKLLVSPPENWDSIIEVLGHPSLKGVIAAVTGYEYQLIVEPAYQERAKRMLESLSRVPHILIVHESTLTGSSYASDAADDTHSYLNYLVHRDRFRGGDDDVRAMVNELFEQHGLSVMPYRNGAEMSSLMVSFIEDNERDLLFRVYIPSGRLYALEADRLLSLFRDWLGQVGRHSVRQDGYRTAAGQVYEFFGDGSLDRHEVSREFDNFSDFLTLCIDDPKAATDQLARTGIDSLTGEQLVSRYGRDVRRIHLDLRHSREARLLALRHSLESELLDSTIPPGQAPLQALLERLVPAATGVKPEQILTPSRPLTATQLTLNVHQQFISRVEGHVTQNIRGTMHLGADAKEILALIERFGGNDANDLESALHELEDSASRPADRFTARQRLKAFLIRIQGHVETAALAVLQRYVESKIGLS